MAFFVVHPVYLQHHITCYLVHWTFEINRPTSRTDAINFKYEFCQNCALKKPYLCSKNLNKPSKPKLIICYTKFFIYYHTLWTTGNLFLTDLIMRCCDLSNRKSKKLRKQFGAGKARAKPMAIYNLKRSDSWMWSTSNRLYSLLTYLCLHFVPNSYQN